MTNYMYKKLLEKGKNAELTDEETVLLTIEADRRVAEKYEQIAEEEAEA